MSQPNSSTRAVKSHVQSSILQVPVCDICNATFTSQKEYDQHLIHPRHKKIASGLSTTLVRCPICNRYMDSGSCWSDHVRGSQHISRAKALGISATVEPAKPVAAVPGFKFCATCNNHVPENQWGHHARSKRHTSRLRYSQYQLVIEEAEKDKNGVSISGDFDFDIVESGTASNGVKRTGSIRTNSTSQIKLVEVYLVSSKGTNRTSS